MDSMDRKGVERKFSDVCEEWLCMERLVVKQSTYARYEHTVRKHIVPVIGERNISDINSSAVNYFVYEKLHHGRADGCRAVIGKDSAGYLRYFEINHRICGKGIWFQSYRR